MDKESFSGEYHIYTYLYIYIYIYTYNFDVAMGSYDGPEVCALSGIFTLSLIGHKYKPNNMGLYSDDGLVIFKNTSGCNLDKLNRIFKKCLRTKV